MTGNNKKYNMSYSMVVDNNYFKNNELKRRNFLSVKEREIHSWIKNDSVTNCYNCGKEFWFYLRKHHCRSCGRIFCCYCTEKTVELPKDIEKFPNEPEYWSKSIENVLLLKDTVKQRVCDKCYDRLCQIKKVKNLIKMFNMIDCDIYDLHNFINVCRSWKEASIHLLSKFREIQYKLPTQKLTSKEIEMLWINKEHLIGHSKWITQLIKATNFENEKQVNDLNDLLFNKDLKKMDCFYTLCTRYCNNKLSAEDALELLRKDIGCDSVQKYIANSFLEISEEEFLCYIPYITYYLYNQPHLANVLLKKSLESVKLRTQFYWSVSFQAQLGKKNYFEGVKKCLIELVRTKLGEDDVKKLESTNKTVKCFEDIKSIYVSSKGASQGLEYEIKELVGDSVYNPICPEKEYEGIETKNIDVKDSATNPVVIPLYYHVHGKKHVDKVMFKNECVLKDQIVTNIITLIDIILKREEGLDLDIVKYKVIPTSKTTGLVEMVKDSVTIYDILEKRKTTIQNFIIDHNKEKKICEIRSKFIKSTAAYCIISYLLGIGDRHLDNIMISKSGALFHIDYGYILGCDPKYTSQNIRITPDILDAMGGSNGPDYEYFKKLCTQIYNCLRRHVSLFMNLLIMLTEIDQSITIDRLQEEIIKRFEPGENTVEAKLHLENKMNNSRQTYEHTVVDFVHKSFKENSVLAGINSVFKMTSNSGSYFYNFMNK